MAASPIRWSPVIVTFIMSATTISPVILSTMGFFTIAPQQKSPIEWVGGQRGANPWSNPSDPTLVRKTWPNASFFKWRGLTLIPMAIEMYVPMNAIGWSKKLGKNWAGPTDFLWFSSLPDFARPTLAFELYANSRIEILCASQIVTGTRSLPLPTSTRQLVPILLSCLKNPKQIRPMFLRILWRPCANAWPRMFVIVTRTPASPSFSCSSLSFLR